MVERYEMPWRPNFEAVAATGWCMSSAVAILSAQFTSLPPAPFHWSAALGAAFGAHQAYKAYGHHRRKARLSGHELKFISMDELKANMKKDQLWLGMGFTWDQPHTQLCYEILKRDKSKILPQTQQMGSPWIHGLSTKDEDLHLQIADTKGHVLVVGTTRSGKTRLFDLLVTQAIMRGECVIIIDPKGDKDLRNNAARACQAMGQPERFVWFHPGFPEMSACIDPMKNFNRATELAARIAGQMKGDKNGDGFMAYSQMALNNVIQGLLLTGVSPNLINIKSYLDSSPLFADLVAKSLGIWCGKHVPTWQDEIQSYLAKAKDDEGRANAYIKYYRDRVAEIAPNPDLEGLISQHEHDKSHHAKMIATLMPLMNQLTSGHLGRMLSPDPQNMDDARRMTDMTRIIEQGKVCYVGLDSLTDKIVGQTIGSILLADLASVAGDRYNYGVNNRPVNLFVDEAAEVVNDQLISLLNKSGGADFRLLIATQTLADFTAALGSEPKARQVLGNLNNQISLRIIDQETQQYIADSLPPTWIKYTMTTQGSSIGVGGHGRMEFSGNSGERLMEEEVPMFSAPLLGQLPNLEFVAKVSGAKLWKGRLPILKN
ncbi:conjugative transfer system coupling protein TraD [Azospirillum sp. SYSU D00513]|uniref:conjugative transfer system coupling protein TraD n=1 Tax=Azospirillum sp. SYSU D00513 TaxID=2812561 RepID=UPI001A97B5C5|nr:conjugative transfer system coupling protein TraD [Azospirillum sp. SYSU D00513]